VRPSPARAEPADETAWLPVPTPDGLPPVEDLVTDPADDPATRDIPVGLPSPARAEPHDETSWLPLPEVEDLPDITELVDPDRATTAAPPSPPATRRHRVAGTGPRRALAAALCVAIVAGGIVLVPKLFSNGDHVQLRVDGRVVSAQSGQDTVGAFLHEQKVNLAPDDLVTPKASSSLSDGMTVRVLRAFPVTVDIDGNVQTMHTAYSQPASFIATLKLPSTMAVRTVPPHLQAGSLVQLRTRRKGTLNVDGQAVNFNLPVLTVRELLDYYKVVLGPQDYTTPGIDAVIPADLPFVNVIRVAEDTTFQDVPYSVPDEIQPDPNLIVGQNRDQPGSLGTMRITYQITKNNGNAVGQTPISQVPTVPAQPTIHFFGTKADPRWDNIARCETGSNWSMQGPMFSGGLGIYNGTWNAFGGQQFGANAGLATREQQIIVAERIRARYGFGAWGCGKKLGYG
jgi:resuscitation-promoting factor RpfB